MQKLHRGQCHYHVAKLPQGGLNHDPSVMGCNNYPVHPAEPAPWALTHLSQFSDDFGGKFKPPNPSSGHLLEPHGVHPVPGVPAGAGPLPRLPRVQPPAGLAHAAPPLLGHRQRRVPRPPLRVDGQVGK